LKNILNFERNIEKYVLKNTPSNLPVISKYVECYMKAMFRSELINQSLNNLEACFGDGLESSQVFDNGKNEYVETWSEGDCTHFILKDFCSIVGFTYKPEYKEAILRSFNFKGIQFYRWLFSTYLEVPILDIYVSRSVEETSWSVTDPEDKSAFTDIPGAFTDLSVRGFTLLNIMFRSRDKEKVFTKLNKYKDLFSMVLPARFFVNFFFGA